MQVNRAVALCYAGDAEAALTHLRGWRPIESYGPYHAARAEIRVELGRPDDAALALARAVELTVNQAERGWLEARRERLSMGS